MKVSSFTSSSISSNVPAVGLDFKCSRIDRAVRCIQSYLSMFRKAVLAAVKKKKGLCPLPYPSTYLASIVGKAALNRHQLISGGSSGFNGLSLCFKNGPSPESFVPIVRSKLVVWFIGYTCPAGLSRPGAE